MKKEENFKKQIHPKTGFIPEIYHFCDKLCDECQFSSLCMNFVLYEKMQKRFGESLSTMQLIGGTAESSLSEEEGIEQMQQILEELAVERGVELEDIMQSESIKKEFWGEDYEEMDQEPNQASELVVKDDIFLTFSILDHLQEQFQEKLIIHLENLEEEDDDSDIHAERFLSNEKRLERIDWYLDIIYAKTLRALYGYYLSRSGFVRDQSHDYNGCVKLCMVCLGKMKLLGEELYREFPAYERDFTWFNTVVDQLLRDFESRFPRARSFRRPGFD